MAKKDSGEDILKAIMEKGGQGAKGREALEKAAAELQAATKVIGEAAEAQKVAAQKQTAAATSQQEAAVKQKSTARTSEVSNITQRISGAVGASTTGIASNVGAAIKEQTLGGAFSLKGMAAAMSESLGLRGLGLALGSRGGGGSRGESVTPVKQLDTLTDILEVTKDNKEVLLSILEAIKGSQAAKIEASREAGGIQAPGPGGAGAGAAKAGEGGGGFLKGLVGMASAAIGPILSAFSSIGGVIKTLLGFVTKLNPITAILSVALAGLEAKDFAEMFESFSKIFTDLSEGRFLDAIVRLIGTLADTILTGFGRLFVKLLELFNFTETANAVKEFLDNMNLSEQLLAFVKAIPEMVIGAYNKVKETIMGWVQTASEIADRVIESIKGMYNAVVDGFIAFKDKVVEKITQYIDAYVSTVTTVFNSFVESITKAWDNLLSGNIVSAIVESLTALPNAVVKGIGNLVSKLAKFFGFEDVSNKIAEFFDGFDIAKSVIDFGTKVKDKTVQRFGAMWDAVGEWWDSFSIVEPITQAFTNIKDRVVNYFGGIGEKLSEVFNFDIGSAIAEKVSGVTQGVTNFFKNLPSSLINALPDGIVKSTIQKYLGGSGESNDTTGTTRSTPTQTPVVQPVYDMEGNQISPGTVAPVESPRAMNAVTGTNNAAVASAAGTSTQPIIVNNVTNNSSTSGGGSAPRISGAVSTAPVPSHVDRALYGSGYGAGVP